MICMPCRKAADGDEGAVHCSSVHCTCQHKPKGTGQKK